MHSPRDRNARRIFEGQREGERGKEEGWRGEQRPELAGQSRGLEFILLLCGVWIVGKRAAARSVRRLPQYLRESLWGLETKVVEVVMEVQLEKSHVWNLLEVGSTELAGKLRWGGRGAVGEREFKSDS